MECKDVIIFFSLLFVLGVVCMVHSIIVVVKKGWQGTPLKGKRDLFF